MPHNLKVQDSLNCLKVLKYGIKISQLNVEKIDFILIFILHANKYIFEV
jgi:hypothetical protein